MVDAGAMLYHLSQTREGATLEGLRGRLVPTDALTAAPLPAPTSNVLREAVGGYPTSQWVREEFLCLGLRPAPEARAICITVEETYEDEDEAGGGGGSTDYLHRLGFSRRPVASYSETYYNLADLVVSSELLTRLRECYPRSASTRKCYRPTVAVPLLKVALRHSLTSPFWVTMKGALYAGSRVVDDSLGVRPTARSDTVLHNTECCAQSEDFLERLQSGVPRAMSGYNGKPFSEESQSALREAKGVRGFNSVYWMTRKQARELGSGIRPGSVSVTVPMSGGTREFYNVDQTESPTRIMDRLQFLGLLQPVGV